MSEATDNGKWFTSQRAMAKAYGVDRDTVARWMARSGFPAKTPHGWNRLKVKAWVDKYNEEKKAALPDDGDKARKLRLECERLEVSIKREQEVLAQEEIKTKQLRGKLVPVEQLREDITDLVQMFTAGLDQAVIDFGAKTRNAKHTESLKKTLDGLRRKLSADLEDA